MKKREQNGDDDVRFILELARLQVQQIFITHSRTRPAVHASKFARIVQVAFCIGATVACASATSADIYQLTRPDGSISFSTNPSDLNAAVVSVDSFKPLLSTRAPLLSALIDQISATHGMDAALIRAIINVESRFEPHAISPKGAVGAMQLMPATAQRYGVSDRTDPAQNIDAGVRYLKDLLRIHHDNLPLALAAYNAGEGSVSRHGRRIPPYRETMLYVPAVLARLHAYRALPKP